MDPNPFFVADSIPRDNPNFRVANGSRIPRWVHAGWVGELVILLMATRNPVVELTSWGEGSWPTIIYKAFGIAPSQVVGNGISEPSTVSPSKKNIILWNFSSAHFGEWYLFACASEKGHELQTLLFDVVDFGGIKDTQWSSQHEVVLWTGETCSLLMWSIEIVLENWKRSYPPRRSKTFFKNKSTKTEVDDFNGLAVQRPSNFLVLLMVQKIPFPNTRDV